MSFLIDSARFAALFTPDSDPNIVFHATADAVSGADGDSVGEEGGAVKRWIPTVGAVLANSAWAFGTKPILKTNILNGHQVVRFDGVDNQNNMVSLTAVAGTVLLVFMCGIKRGSKANAGFLTINDNSADDYDAAAECSFYETGAGGADGLACYRTALKATTFYPGVGVPFIACYKFDATNNTNHLGDYPSLAVASTGTFAADRIGLGARHTSNGYNNNSRIDIAEVMIFQSAGNTLRRNATTYLNTKYGLLNPKVVIVIGDSISAGDSQWPGILKFGVWNAGQYYVENLAVGGHNLDQNATDATSADIYNRIAARDNPERTVVIIWEYVNAKNPSGANNTDQQVVDKTKLIADLAKAASPLCKVLVCKDFHKTESIDCSGASALMAAQYTGFSDGIVDLDLQSLRDDAAAFDAAGGKIHLSATGEGIVAGLMQTAVEALFQ